MNIPSLSNACLVLDHAGTRRVVPIDSVPFTIGRGPDRDLLLAHPQVSREHACIEQDGAGYLLRDRGSRHGTFVNGVKIHVARLRSKDRIKFGNDDDALLFEDANESTIRTLMAKLSETAGAVADQNDLEKLSLFLQAVQSLSSSGAIDDVLRTMLKYAIRLTRADRGFVFLGESAELLRLECAQDNKGARLVGQPAISYSVVRDAARSQLDFVISEVTDEFARGRESLIVNAIRSVVAIPLRCEGSSRLLGLLYLDSQSRTHDFNRIGNDILHAIARQATTLIEHLRLLQMEYESALLKKDLEIAASIQRQIIPQRLPAFPFARVSARTVPCAGIGGDFYDVIPVRSGFVAIVADVCGKGIPAALLASTVQGMFHGQVGTQGTGEFSLADAVQSVNAFIYSRAPQEEYVTLVVLRYVQSDSGNAHIELVNAGHVAPIIVRADGVIEKISDGDIPVGLFEDVRFHSIHLTLALGDRIVLLSDGITEAEDKKGVQFGLAQHENHFAGVDPVSAIFSAVEKFCMGACPQDDRTVLAIDRTV